MFDLSVTLRRSLAGAYLAGSEALTHRMLGDRLGKRDFRRVIVVAALGRSNGIARGARLQWEALQTIGVEAELLDATAALRNPFFRIPHRPGSAYIFHSAGPQTVNMISSVLPHAAQAYRIGYWAWELPDPPLEWLGSLRNIAEIWTPSTFSQASLAQLGDRPVEVVPHYVSVHPARQRRQNSPFTVLAMADSRSSWSRKNPEGALRAFRTAFGTSTAARLVLKLGGRAEELCSLEASFGPLLDCDNVEIVRGNLTQAALMAVYRGADVLLSLHRAEGYGLPMSEAMAHGLPVVATGWSGNLDFMDASNSCLVPYKLVPVDDISSIYAGSTWAEPDLNAAAQMLRRLADEHGLYTRLAAAAHRRASAAAPRFPFAARCGEPNGNLRANA